MKTQVLLLTLIFCMLKFNNVFSQESLKELNSDTLAYNINGEIIKLVCSDKNPNHYPIINLSQGIGFSGTPHYPINPIFNLEGKFNIAKLGTLNINYTKLPRFWVENGLSDEIPIDDDSKPFKSIDMNLSIHLFTRSSKKKLTFFYKSELVTNHEQKLTYLKVPNSSSNKYFDLRIGYLYYRDIVSKEPWSESMDLYSTDGTQLGESIFGFHNQVFQLGVYFGREEYMRGVIKYKNKRNENKTRNLQSIISAGYYFDILYSGGSKYDDIKTKNQIYKLDKNRSNLTENKFGFRFGYTTTEAIIGTWVGFKYGFELGLYPGIMGYPKAIFNLYGRCYLSYSLHFFKKNGTRWEF